MGARHISPEEVLEMQRLYSIHGTFAAVGRIMGRSASSVAKYVKMEGVPRSLRLAVETLAREREL